jgi:aconitase A
MSTQEELLKEIKVSIEKSLPAIQADVFKKYIEESEKSKIELEKLKSDYLALKIMFDKQKEEVSSLRSLNIVEDKIKADRISLDLDKLKFDIEKKLTEAHKISSDEKVVLLQGVMNSVFRNIDVRKSVFDSTPVVLKDSCGYERVESRQSSHIEDINNV